MRSLRARLLLLLTMLLAGVAISALSVTEAQGQSRGPTAADLDRLVAAQGGPQRSRDRARRRQSQEARKERRESRTRHRGKDRRQALELARVEHRGVMEARPDDLPELSDGQKVDAYIGPQTARIDNGPGAPDSLMVSTTPLRARDETGSPAPVDYDLIEGDSAYGYDNPAVAARLGKDLDDGLLLEKAGIRVTPVTDAEVAPVATAGRLFWSDVATDLDFFVNPAPSGFEFFLQIRSVDAPESFSVDLDLPAGAVLVPPAAEGDPIEVRRGDEVLGSIHPPSAWGADGETLPVTFDLDGGRLTLRFPHRDQDVAYPALVDPLVSGQVYDDFLYWKTNYGIPFGRWRYETQPSSRPMFGGQDANSAAADYRGRGLISAMYGNSYYYAGDYGQWLYDAPAANTFIYRAEFHQAYHRDNYTSLYEGVYSLTRGQWDTGSTNGIASPWSYPYYLQNDTKVHCVHQGAESPCAANARGRNTAVFGLRVDSTMGRSQGPYAYLTGARIFLADTTSPNVYAVSHQQDMNRWYRSGTLQTNVGANDNQGLGMRSIDLSNYAAESYPDQIGCEGDRVRPCSQDLYGGVRYNVAGLGDGVHTLQVRARDVLGKAGYSSFQVKVDKTAPTLGLSGSVWDRRGASVTEADPQLVLDASDATSGVEALEVRVDGAARAPSQTSGDRRTFSFANLGEGQHRVEVAVRDRAGNSAPGQAWDVIVDRNPVRIVRVDHTGRPSGWVRDFNATATIEGDDLPAGQPSHGTGVRTLKILRNESEWKRLTFGCDGTTSSRCQRTATGILSYSASASDFATDGIHTLTAAAEDGVRESRSESWEVRLDRTGPEVALEGTLLDVDDEEITDPEYSLTFRAGDDLQGTGAVPSSGTSLLVLSVDGVEKQRIEQGCQQAPCTLNGSAFAFDTGDYADGPHTIRVEATDEAGNRTTREIEVDNQQYSVCMDAYNDATYCDQSDRDEPQAPADAGEPEPGLDLDPLINSASCYLAYPTRRELCDGDGTSLPEYEDPAASETRTARAAATASDRVYGIADESLASVRLPAVDELKVRRLRRILPYNIARYSESGRATPPSGVTAEQVAANAQKFDEFKALYESAYDTTRTPKQDIMVSFEHRQDIPEARSSKEYPTVNDYVEATAAFRNRFPRVQVMSPWNEPNNRTQPTSNSAGGPKRAARYAIELKKKVCKRSSTASRTCLTVVGEFLDVDGWKTYFKTYRDYLESRRDGSENADIDFAYWALHPYVAVKLDKTFSKRLKNSSAVYFRNRVPDGEPIWFTEVGSRVDAGRNTPTSQAGEVSFLLEKLAARSADTPVGGADEPGGNAARVYYYNVCESKADSPGMAPRQDPGLLGRPGPGEQCGAPRPAFNVFKNFSTRNPFG